MQKQINPPTPLLLSMLPAAVMYGLLLYTLERTQVWPIIGLFGGLFLLYAWWMKEGEKIDLRLGFSAALLFRLIAFFALPVLSDDYFRFIWDGQLLAHGENPFTLLPSEHMSDPSQAASLGLSQELYDGLNSQNYFTIYPPVLQLIFFLGAAIFPKSIYGAVLVMKVPILLAEIGSIRLIQKLLTHFRLPQKWMWLYALNPLVIVELTGSLHFEALMIFFLLLAIWWLANGKWLLSAVPFALAICSKLLPLMLLPLLFKRIGFWKTAAYSSIVGVLTLLMFLPLYDLETFAHIRESVALYVSVFEFNASLWYVIREIAYLFVPYNIIRIAGPFISAATIIFILLFSFFQPKASLKNLASGMSWVFLIYFSLASIVHPWYGTTLVALSSLGRYRYAMFWSAFLPLSYVAYRQLPEVHEVLWLVALEYVVVLVVLIREWKNPLGQQIATSDGLS
ncbi:MAG: hypothetical protein AAF206_31420 [Bacteroidota bacterium]